MLPLNRLSPFGSMIVQGSCLRLKMKVTGNRSKCIGRETECTKWGDSALNDFPQQPGDVWLSMPSPRPGVPPHPDSLLPWCLHWFSTPWLYSHSGSGSRDLCVSPAPAWTIHIPVTLPHLPAYAGHRVKETCSVVGSAWRLFWFFTLNQHLLSRSDRGSIP